MAEYQIFSDGACDIGFAKAKELGIGLIPFYISIDHETYYKEIQEISLEEYFRYMTEEKGYPKTSLRIIWMHSALPSKPARTSSASP